MNDRKINVCNMCEFVCSTCIYRFCSRKLHERLENKGTFSQIKSWIQHWLRSVIISGCLCFKINVQQKGIQSLCQIKCKEGLFLFHLCVVYVLWSMLSYSLFCKLTSIQNGLLLNHRALPVQKTQTRIMFSSAQ
jgi:hypothetical protein